MALPSERLVRNWRYRSAEMRAISETMKHEETRTTMERLADEYDDMADRLERQANVTISLSIPDNIVALLEQQGRPMTSKEIAELLFGTKKGYPAGYCGGQDTPAMCGYRCLGSQAESRRRAAACADPSQSRAGPADMDLPMGEIDGVPAQLHQLDWAQAVAVSQKHHGGVPRPITVATNGFHEPFHLGRGRYSRALMAALGRRLGGRGSLLTVPLMAVGMTSASVGFAMVFRPSEAYCPNKS
jgi:hypothetical protein